jgi:hypothetical protein
VTNSIPYLAVAIAAALSTVSCMNSVEGALSACDDKTLEQLQTQNTFSAECKTALRKVLPSSDNNVNGAWISLGSGLTGGKTLFLGGTDANGTPLPLPASGQLTVTAVTAAGDSALDTSRYGVKRMEDAAGSRLALTVSTDYSGSMSGEDIRTSSEIYADLFAVLDTAGARFEGSIQRFSDTVTAAYGFSPRADSLKLRAARDTSYVRGSTALFDAVGKAILALSARNAEAKVLVVTTDGFENSSTTYKKAQTLYDLARQHKVRVFMIGNLVADLNFLRTMARQSGGLYIYNGDIADTKPHALKISRLLAHALALELKDIPAGTDSVRVTYGGKTVAFDL